MSDLALYRCSGDLPHAAQEGLAPQPVHAVRGMDGPLRSAAGRARRAGGVDDDLGLLVAVPVRAGAGPGGL